MGAGSVFVTVVVLINSSFQLTIPGKQVMSVPICVSAGTIWCFQAEQVCKVAQISSSEFGVYLDIFLPSLEYMCFLV